MVTHGQGFGGQWRNAGIRIKAPRDKLYPEAAATAGPSDV